jgi:peptide chain release factor 1
MDFNSTIKSIVDKYTSLSEEMITIIPSDQNYIKIAKELSDLNEVVVKIKEYQKKQNDLLELEEMLGSDDQDIIDMAKDEKNSLLKSIPNLEQEIKFLLVPVDKDDQKNIILEIRAGTGGEEAALFAAEMLRVYQRYSDQNRWKWEIMDISNADQGGLKEAVIMISGKGVFGRMKFESGTHRVQRIPKTEKNGRVHTSAITVAVMAEADEVSIKTNANDFRIDVFRSSGPGGQSVNTTDSAVRITHIPTGLVVSQQDEKSQIKNREKGMKIMMARLYELERSKQQQERDVERKQQIGTGDRSEKVRTYNFPQNRITDHRINLTLHNLDGVMESGDLNELIESLITADRVERLSNL